MVNYAATSLEGRGTAEENCLSESWEFEIGGYSMVNPSYARKGNLSNILNKGSVIELISFIIKDVKLEMVYYSVSRFGFCLQFQFDIIMQ